MTSTFQSILLTVFGFLGLIAILIFAGVIPFFGEDANFGGTVVMWGDLPQKQMDAFISELKKSYENNFTLVYEYHDSKTFENDLISTLARGGGPDLILLPHDLILSQGDKIKPIPFSSYSERDFRDTYADIGNMYLIKEGVLAFPLYLDPLVMYWNKDIFSNASVSTYPKTWIEFLELSNNITKKDSKGNIFQSTIAFGTFKNISNAKSIISMLLLQAGDGIVTMETDKYGVATNKFKVSLGENTSVTESAIRFYSEFSNQAKSSYTWNSAMPVSRRAFGNGNLAVYFGFASEYNGIKSENPHLNFDVAVVPQRDDAKTKATFGNMWGVSVLKSSKNIGTATVVALVLANTDYGEKLAEVAGLPSLKRSFLAKSQANPVFSVFVKSAIMGKAWYDPNEDSSDIIFKEMIESILSGKNSVLSAITSSKIRLMEIVK